MKQKWIEPVTVKEEFMPNEYVAACETHYSYSLACNTSQANEIERQHNKTNSKHDPSHSTNENCCGDPDAQHIITDANGYITEMYELLWGTMKLPMTLINGSEKYNGAKLSEVAGQTIEWQTHNLETDKYYCHIGTINASGGVKVMS